VRMDQRMHLTHTGGYADQGPWHGQRTPFTKELPYYDNKVAIRQME
jgi:hypothetical protein